MKHCEKFYQEAMKRENWPKYDFCHPPTDLNICMDILIDELLGENWCVYISENRNQTNTIAVYDILKRYVDNKEKSNISYIVFTIVMTVFNIILCFIR